MNHTVVVQHDLAVCCHVREHMVELIARQLKLCACTCAHVLLHLWSCLRAACIRCASVHVCACRCVCAHARISAFVASSADVSRRKSSTRARILGRLRRPPDFVPLPLGGLHSSSESAMVHVLSGGLGVLKGAAAFGTAGAGVRGPGVCGCDARCTAGDGATGGAREAA